MEATRTGSSWVCTRSWIASSLGFFWDSRLWERVGLWLLWPAPETVFLLLGCCTQLPYESVCFLSLRFVMFFKNYVKMSLHESPTFHHIDSPWNTFLQWSHIAQFDQNGELWGKRDLFRLLWGMEWSSLCPYHLTIIPGLSCCRVCSQSTRVIKIWIFRESRRVSAVACRVVGWHGHCPLPTGVLLFEVEKVWWVLKRKQYKN